MSDSVPTGIIVFNEVTLERSARWWHRPRVHLYECGECYAIVQDCHQHIMWHRTKWRAFTSRAISHSSASLLHPAIKDKFNKSSYD